VHLVAILLLSRDVIVGGEGIDTLRRGGHEGAVRISH
jgi:hypothetical protein